MAKLMAPNIRIDWYPEGHFQDIHNPTIAELNSGVNLSCAVVTGYTLDFTDSNTEDTTTIFDTHTSEAILNHSYEADLEFFLAPRGSNADNEAAYRKAEELFYNPDNRVGYLAKRFGLPWNQKYSWQNFNQRVDLFKVQADLPKVVSEEGAPILLNVKYIPQGEAVSGANAGFQTLWTGEVYNSPRAVYVEDELKAWNPLAGTNRPFEKVWIQETPPPAGTHYNWLGEPHASESVRLDGDGNETARNYSKNPSFETGTHNLETGSRAVNLRITDDDAAVGARSLAYELNDSRGSNGRVAQSIDAEQAAGKYLAYGLKIRSTENMPGTTIRLSVWQSGFTTETLESSPITSDSFADQPRAYGAMELPEGMTGILSIRPIIYGPGTVDGSFQMDAWFIAVADTEGEALTLAQGYFDGDTVSDRANDLWYNTDGVPHEWVNGQGWVESNDTSLVPVPEGFLTAPIHTQ